VLTTARKWDILELRREQRKTATHTGANRDQQPDATTGNGGQELARGCFCLAAHEVLKTIQQSSS